MSEMKPTPGPWSAHHDHGWLVVESACGLLCLKVSKGSASQDHMADALLIAEAGTVFHNTGLSPVQLVEQRDELLAACKKLVEWDEREKDHAISFWDRIDLCNEAFQMMYAALAKCEGVGND